MQDVLSDTHRLNDNVVVGKFTVLTLNGATYVDGCSVASGANAALVAGVALQSIIPDSVADYVAGQYNVASGAAYPANSIPSSPVGRAIAVAKAGIVPIIASAAISLGDRVNTAASTVINGVTVLGSIKTINEGAGTLVHEVGEALEAATAAGDVIKVRLTLVDRHT